MYCIVYAIVVVKTGWWLVAIGWKIDDDPTLTHKLIKKFDDFIADLSLRIWLIMVWALENLSNLLNICGVFEYNVVELDYWGTASHSFDNGAKHHMILYVLEP